MNKLSFYAMIGDFCQALNLWFNRVNSGDIPCVALGVVQKLLIFLSWCKDKILIRRS